MELNVFMRELESALVQRGIPGETAARYVTSIRRTLTDEDIAEINQYQTQDEVNRLADNIFSINQQRRQSQKQSASPGAGSTAPVQQSASADVPRPAAAPSPAKDPYPAPVPAASPAAQEDWAPENSEPAPAYRRDYPAAAPAARPAPYQRPAEPDEDDDFGNYQDERYPEEKRQPAPRPRKKQPARNAQYDDYFDYSPDASPSTKGMIIFWVGLFLTLPLTLGITLGVIAVFAALFAALIALIIVSVVLVVALVAGGSVVSLVAIVFGITQLIGIGGGTFAAGLYEIGLGIMVAGIVFFFSVLLYNFAIRFLPWVISKLAQFFRFLCGKAKDLFFIIRRGCYQL